MSYTTDPIADMLVRIKNANQRKAKTVSIPYSIIKSKIADILLAEGFISEAKVQGQGVEKHILITLKYKGTQKAISGVKRISKPGLRVYAAATEVPTVLSGFGTAIISTSAGVVTDKEARKRSIGGEVIAYV